jgi:nitrite reductase/ring-hydroxylating ferredoxin subunit
MTRRDLLQSAALLACTRSTCPGATARDCCALPEPAPDALHIEPGLVVLDLTRTPQLHHTGDALKIIDPARKLQILVARPERDRFVALSQRCTHGGGPLTYVHRHKHLYCTCWGHAKFALDGAVLRWPNSKQPVPLPAYPVERDGNRLLIRVEGLA